MLKFLIIVALLILSNGCFLLPDVPIVPFINAQETTQK